MTTRRMFLRNSGLALAGAVLLPDLLGQTVWARQAAPAAGPAGGVDQYRYYNIRLKGTDLYVKLGEGSDFFYDEQPFVLGGDPADKRSQFHFRRVDNYAEPDGPKPLVPGVTPHRQNQHRIYCRATGGYISAGGNPVQKRSRSYNGPIEVFADPNFQGASQVLNPDMLGPVQVVSKSDGNVVSMDVYRYDVDPNARYNTPVYPLTIGENTISSVRVLDGYAVTLVGRGGLERSFTADAPYVGDDINDKAYHVVVEKRHGWQVSLGTNGAFQFCSRAVSSKGSCWLGAANNGLVMVKNGAQAIWELVPIQRTTMTGWTRMSLDTPKKSVEDYVIKASFALAGAALSYQKVPGGSAIMSALYENFFQRGSNMADTLKQLRSEILNEANQAITGNDVGIAVDKLHTAQKGFAAQYVLERRRFFANEDSGAVGISGAITEAARYADMARDAAAILSTPLMGRGQSVSDNQDPVLAQWKILSGFDTYAACIMLRWAALKEWVLLSAYNTDGGGWEEELEFMEKTMHDDQNKIESMFQYYVALRRANVKYIKDDHGFGKGRDLINVSVTEHAVPGQQRNLVARRVRRDELNEREYYAYASDYKHEVSFELEYAIFPQFAAFSDNRIKAIIWSTKQTATALAEDDDAAENYRQAILNAKPVYIDA